MTEAEKRLHRCCFTGHRPNKLNIPEQEIRDKLEREIRKAIADGFSTFISGMSPGVDIWSAETVIRLRDTEFPDIHLIAASPYKGFEGKTDESRIQQYNYCIEKADYVKYVCEKYSGSSSKQRNEWMVNHSARVIAVYNETPGGTRNTIIYAKKQKVEIDMIELPSVKAKFAELHRTDLIINAPQLRKEEEAFLEWERESEHEHEYPF